MTLFANKPRIELVQFCVVLSVHLLLHRLLVSSLVGDQTLYHRPHLRFKH